MIKFCPPEVYCVNYLIRCRAKVKLFSLQVTGELRLQTGDVEGERQEEDRRDLTERNLTESVAG